MSWTDNGRDLIFVPDSEWIKLNLGCGQDIRVEDPLADGQWINIDQYPRPGIDHVVDLEAKLGIPLPDESVDYVLASHFLEHIVHLDRVMREIHRVLVPGGILEIFVPYGIRSLYDPFHLHAFNATSFDRFMSQDMGLQSGRLFDRIQLRIRKGPPLEWHIRRYFPRIYQRICGSGHDINWPVGSRRELHVLLRRAIP